MSVPVEPEYVRNFNSQADCETTFAVLGADLKNSLCKEIRDLDDSARLLGTTVFGKIKKLQEEILRLRGEIKNTSSQDTEKLKKKEKEIDDLKKAVAAVTGLMQKSSGGLQNITRAVDSTNELMIAEELQKIDQSQNAQEKMQMYLQSGAILKSVNNELTEIMQKQIGDTTKNYNKMIIEYPTIENVRQNEEQLALRAADLHALTSFVEKEDVKKALMGAGNKPDLYQLFLNDIGSLTSMLENEAKRIEEGKTPLYLGLDTVRNLTSFVDMAFPILYAPLGYTEWYALLTQDVVSDTELLRFMRIRALKGFVELAKAFFGSYPDFTKTYTPPSPANQPPSGSSGMEVVQQN